MTWAEELSVMFKEADGDLGVFLLLAALRKTENGSPGREMGILDKRATTFTDQVHWAGNTIRNNAWRAVHAVTTIKVRDPQTGLFTMAFMTYFSHIYAPIGAENDPRGLNKNHLHNLTTWHDNFAMQAERALTSLKV